MSEIAVDAVRMAEILSVTPATVRAMVHRGEIPGFKAGRHWRFLPSKVLAQLEAPKYDKWEQPARARVKRATR